MRSLASVLQAASLRNRGFKRPARRPSVGAQDEAPASAFPRQCRGEPVDFPRVQGQKLGTKEADAKVAAAEKKAKEAEKKEAAVGWSLFPSSWGTTQVPEEPMEPEAPEGKKVVKRVLVAVASALIGVALLPFK